MLAVRDFSAGYGQTVVIRELSFDVEEGSITVLLGSNGAGKSTTLRALSGLISWKGMLRLDGQTIRGLAPEKIVRMGMAHVPEGRGVFGSLTVLENLQIGAYLRRGKTVDQDIDEWFELFPNLAARRNEDAASLSGGEQQMLAVSRALMSRPKVLLLDEPSLGLAPMMAMDLFAALARVNEERGTSMLIVEQNANAVLRFANYGFVLSNGKITLDGTAEKLKQDPQIRLAYLGT